MPRTRQNAAHAMSRARAALITREPFFGSLVLGLRLKEDESCHQIWTDGSTLGYHPAFAAALPHEKLVGALAHEALHLACGHHARRQGREPRLWNEACDVVINDILLEAGFRLPEGALSRPEYAGLAVESVYRELLSRRGSRGEQQPLGSSGKKSTATGARKGDKEKISGEGVPRTPSEMDQKSSSSQPRQAIASETAAAHKQDVPLFNGEIRDDPRLREALGEKSPQTQRDVETTLDRALDRARHAGSIPAGCHRLLRRTGRPEQDWASLLRRFLARCADNDYSWCHPARRFLHQDIYLPGRHDMKISSLAVAVDCSGSVDDLALSSFCTELGAALAPYDTEAVILFHDCQVQAVHRIYGREFPSSLTPVGGGGTDFRPVTAWLENNGERPAALLWFTDLECASFPDSPGYPVLWLVWGEGGQKPPFGETVYMTSPEVNIWKERP